ncbi:MAG: hypothetical protein AAF389_01865 [Gemmatimonadota bacterium]
MTGRAESLNRAAPPMRRIAPALLFVLAGCEAEPGAVSTGVPLLSPDLAIEVGQFEGPEEYVFAAIESVRPRPDGSIVVADGGANRVHIYEADGTFRAGFGSEGEGPGEFRNLGAAYPHTGDSILAAERFEDRLTVFSATGDPGRTLRGSELSGDETFRLDSWIHGRYWVHGAMTVEGRTRVRAILDQIGPPPRERPEYREVATADDGGLWIAAPATDTGTRWTHVTAQGAPSAQLDLPARFRPTHFGDGEVWGVWTGEADVHFARAYTVSDSGTEATPPAWIGGAPGASPPAEEVPTEEELMDLVRSSIRSIASAQEMHYSTAFSYTADLAELGDIQAPEALMVHIAQANDRGWVGIFTHAASDRACVLGYGFTIPAGWSPGYVACAPPTGSER